MVLTCKEVSSLVSESLDRRLSWRERLGVNLHLLICKACRRFADQMRFLHAAARQFSRNYPIDMTSTRLSESARRRIRHALEHHD